MPGSKASISGFTPHAWRFLPSSSKNGGVFRNTLECSQFMEPQS